MLAAVSGSAGTRSMAAFTRKQPRRSGSASASSATARSSPCSLGSTGPGWVSDSSSTAALSSR
jgi:hypothetical protein